ncbi:MAG: hypothetical protein MRY21_02835 [Simkaniaceae bacterium]|nr:hypothetical protein [Simkaniaceae bacterium]
MRRWLIGLFLFTSIYGQNSYIFTNPPWRGRLGDQLILIAKASWLAYKYNGHFLLKRHKLLEAFDFHLAPTPELSSYHFYSLSRHKKDFPKLGGLYRVSMAYRHPDWKMRNEVAQFKGLIDNPEFLDHFRKLFRPNVAPKPLDIPSDCVTVAVHIRKGGGVDSPLLSKQYYDQSAFDLSTLQRLKISFKEVDLGEPLKFPPEQYYVDQICRLSAHLHHAPLYIHIFTDDLVPDQLLKRLRSAVNLDNITWAVREEECGPKRHVIDDLYAMTQFDCLIRSGSNFAQVAHLLKDYRVVIYPLSSGWIGRSCLVIDQTEMVINGKYTFKGG